jgi:hypothetical protein
MAKDPQQIAAKWAQRLQGATQDIQNGVMNVTVSPTSQAAAKKDKWVAGIQKAAASGKWEAGLNKVSLQSWQNSMIQKGLPRVGQGATAAQPKMADFMAKLIPYQTQLQSTIKAMPDLTLEDNLNRAMAFMRGMSNFKK